MALNSEMTLSVDFQFRFITGFFWYFALEIALQLLFLEFFNHLRTTCLPVLNRLPSSTYTVIGGEIKKHSLKSPVYQTVTYAYYMAKGVALLGIRATPFNIFFTIYLYFVRGSDI